MQVRRYQRSDFESINGWTQAREKPRVIPSNLPEIGLVVDGIACIFLIQNDTATAILDFFITNPDASLADRLKACDLMIAEAERLATALGYDAIVGNTKILKVRALGMRYGFTSDPDPYFLFYKPLGEQPNERRNDVYSSHVHPQPEPTGTGT